MFYQPPIMNPDSSKTKTIFMFSPINCQKTHKTSSGTWFSSLLCVTDMTVIWFCDWKSYIYCMIFMLKSSYRRNSMIRSPCSIRTPAHSFKNMKHNTVKMTRHSRPQWGGDSWMLIPHFGWSNLFLGKVKLFGNCTNTKWNSHSAESQVWSNNNSYKLVIGGCSSGRFG